MEHVTENTLRVFEQTVNTVVDVLNSTPGVPLLVKYVQNSYAHDSWRLFLEFVLLVIIIKYLFSKAYKPKEKIVQLTPKEVDELIEEWEPTSLVPPEETETTRDIGKLPILEKGSGPVVSVHSKEKVNFVSYNFLGLCGDTDIEKNALETLRSYGVGTCGPPGFYGTLDIHQDLEKEVATFLGTEEAILYSFGFSTIASTIPAFAKKGDLIFSDIGVNFACQRGILVSRADYKFFKHNDMDDLEAMLKAVVEKDKKTKKPLNRRFIVVEGLYQNYGDICPLPKLIEFKKKYKFRLIVEESMSFGALGDTGRGVCEHFGISAREIDAITFGMGNALAAAGGICAGSHPIVDHQRLSGQGYCYSASMPAMLAQSSRQALARLKKEPERLTTLRRNIKLFRSHMADVSNIKVDGDDVSPVFHIRLTQALANRVKEEDIIQEIVQEANEKGVLFTRAKYVANQEVSIPQPSIRVCLSQAHTEEQIAKGTQVLKEALGSVIGKWTNWTDESA